MEIFDVFSCEVPCFFNRRISSDHMCEPFTKYQEDVIPQELKSLLMPTLVLLGNLLFGQNCDLSSLNV